MSKFERAWASMVAELVGVGTPFDGESVMATFAPVGVPGSGVPTTVAVAPVKRCLKHHTGLSGAAVNRMLNELVGVTTTAGLTLARSGATKFQFDAEE